MSSQFDSATADFIIICAHCKAPFRTKYPDTKYCSVQHKDSAAKKRQRARSAMRLAGLDTEQLAPVPVKVISHPIATDAFKKKVSDYLNSPLGKFQQEFLTANSRLPEPHEIPAELAEPSPASDASYLSDWMPKTPIEETLEEARKRKGKVADAEPPTPTETPA